MFERYSEAARLTIFRARYVASQVGSEEIDTEHLLMGVLTDIPSGQPGRILLPRRQKRGVSSRQSSDRTNSNSRRKPHGQTEILVAVAGSPISGTRNEGPGIEKDFENLDEKFLGD